MLNLTSQGYTNEARISEKLGVCKGYNNSSNLFPTTKRYQMQA